MTHERRSDWQLIDDALRAVEAHRPVDRPRFPLATFALLVAMGAVVVVALLLWSRAS